MVENIYLDRDGGNPREKHTWGLDALTLIKTQFHSMMLGASVNQIKKTLHGTHLICALGVDWIAFI